MMQTNPFTSLVGESISAVAFVMDYVEFHFNGPRLRALTNPVVHTAAIDIQFPNSGSRDALCSLIGQAVENVRLKETQFLELIFASGVSLVIPLGAQDLGGPEALHWHPDDDLRNMMIW